MPNFVLDRFSLSPSVGEPPPPILRFLDSAIGGVANWQESEKDEHGCTTTNLTLSNGIKIVSVLQRLHGEIGRTNSDVQKRDGQTNKQTDRQTDKLEIVKPRLHDTTGCQSGCITGLTTGCIV